MATSLSLAIVAGLAMLPVSFIATFFLLPFWGWLESAYGIESVGHSGPSGWCFKLTYALLGSATALAVLVSRHRAIR